MSVLSVSNLGQSFGAVDIFAGISFSVPPKSKIGLVGPNGIGKTTLLLILAGQEEPSRGQVHVAKQTRIGYLPQEAARAFAGNTHTVYEEIQTVFAHLKEKEARLRQLEQEMAERTEDEALFEEYGALLERFEQAGGYDYELHIKQTLDGLGFDEEGRHLPLTHLSGGQKTRALLARLLLEKPDLLIMDEPTNHLDIEAIEWLENTLNSWDGAILIVSHDRYFLDKVVNRIWEMSRDNLEVYRGNYSHYVQQRQERWERREQEFTVFKERMEKELDYIRKHIASQNTAQAKGKLKRVGRELNAVLKGGLQAVNGGSWLESGGSSVDWSVGEAMEALKSIQPPSHRPLKLNFRLANTHRSGNVVLRTKDLAVGYAGKPLFRSANLELWRGECAALIGQNGTGKSTFLKTLLQTLQPVRGQFQLGASLQIGYFAQAHESLNPQNQVLDELMRHHPMQVSEARSHLARYLFRGDDVYKLVGELSGGERGRLALSVLALEGANFLLLDEPTNHLDIPAQEMLQSVLEHFAGTILLVSHDRYLIDHLATQIWWLNAGRLDVFKGNYQSYLAHLAQEKERQQQKKQFMQQKTQQNEKDKPPLSNNALRQRAEALAKLEKDIHDKEEGLAALSEAMQEATLAQDFDKIQSLGIEYEATERCLENLLEEWENFASE